MTHTLSPLALRARLAALACLGVVAAAPAQAGGPPPDYAPMVARYARQHGVPERLVHRVIMRESRYNPRVVAHGNYGLMQIKLATARGMGYAGGAQGLLDPEINMRHAVPYLANAYIVARGDEDRAVQYYAGGYYYAAKRQGLLARMRTAHSGAARHHDAPDERKTIAHSEPAEAAPVEPGAAPRAQSQRRGEDGETRRAVSKPGGAKSESRRAEAKAARAERVAMRRAPRAAPLPEPRPVEAEAAPAPVVVERMPDPVRD